MVSDDESSTASNDDVQQQYKSSEEAALESLQTETMPAIPSEQDRKRFIGCLAAVLAANYEYDFSEIGEEGEASAAYLEVYVHEEEGFRSSTSSMLDDNRAPLPRVDSNDSCSFDDDDELLEGFSVSENETIQEDSAGESGANNERSTSSLADEKSMEGTGTPARQLPRKSSAMSLSQATMFHNRRDAQMLKLSLSRHRRRRYEVLSNVLLRAASFLDLEASQSKAFLPLLARLLKPPLKSEEENTERDLLGVEKENFLWPFLESLTPGSGFRCLSMLLLEHLLRGSEGYDARVRRVYKKLSVLVLLQDGEYADRDDCNDMTEIEFATRKFEAMEHEVAFKILELSGGGKRRHKSLKGKSIEGGVTREQVMRGLKIGSAGLVAGTLFAVTGGLAAPGIAAGVGALVGTASTAAAVVALTSTAAVTTIFGVGGAGLAAYKMHRRSQGLTEFEFQKESGKEEGAVEAELFTTICISGWLRDHCDFQRPWGVQPSNPAIRDRLELLERFYAVHKPENVPRCEEILSRWRGYESKLWGILRQKYGRDPSRLFPLENGPRDRSSLTVDQRETIHRLFVALGYVGEEEPEEGETPLEKMRTGWRARFSKNRNKEESAKTTALDVSLRGGASFSESEVLPKGDLSDDNKGENASEDLPDHIRTVWDYHKCYGGELYTVLFESDMLSELCNSVEDVAVDAVSNATQQILKTTVFATLLTAVAIPTALVKLANMIDGSWTLAIERSDEAGKELAKSLLFSQAGRRPVTLIGFSMGARVIYACLKELARYQEKWEQMRDEAEKPKKPPNRRASRRSSSKQSLELENMREPASILEDVIVMGMPNHLSLRSWYLARQLVAGRLVNCYSKKDLVLTLMFRYKRMTGGFKPICGTSAIEVPGVENYDVSDLITAHSQYTIEAGTILKRIGHGQPIRAPNNNVVVVTESTDDGK